jgi:hypothetical protein
MFSGDGESSIPLDLAPDLLGTVLSSLLLPGLFGYGVVAEAEQVEEDLRRAHTLIGEATSVFTLGPIREQLEHNVDVEAIGAAGTLMRLVSIALEDGYRQYVTEDGDLIRVSPVHRQRHRLEGGDLKNLLIDGALASAAIPGVFPPVVLQSRGMTFTSVDGGVRDVVPLNAAFDVIRHDLPEATYAILAISAGPAGQVNPLHLVGPRQPAPDFTDANFIELAARGVEIAIDEIHHNELSPLGSLPDDASVIYITPLFPVHDSMTIDPGLLQIAIAYGYMSAFDEIARPGLGREHSTAVLMTNWIAQARRRCWELERTATFDPLPSRRGGSSASRGVRPIPQWEEDVVRELRTLKRQIRDAVASRAEMFGPDSIPSSTDLSSARAGNLNSVDDWWQEFERHALPHGPERRRIVRTGNPFVRTYNPWQSLRLVDGGSVAPETPPAGI